MSKSKLAAGFDLPSPPRRTEVREEAAHRFERVERAKGKEKSSTMRRDIVSERLAVYVPAELAERLRLRCARERRSLSDAATEAFERWMKLS